MANASGGGDTRTKAMPQPQPIRRSTTVPVGHHLRRSNDLLAPTPDFNRKHKRGAHSIGTDELTRSGDKEGASLWRRVSKAGSSGLKSISGSVRRATSVRLSRSRGGSTETKSDTRPARVQHGRSLSDAQHTRDYRRNAFLSTGISEGWLYFIYATAHYI